VRHRRSLVGSLLLLAFAAVPAFGQTVAVGRIKVVTGEVMVVRASTPSAAQAGQAVFEGDVLRTGSDGRVGVTLKDDTRVSLGPSSEVRVDRFSYAPAEGQLAVVLKIARGVVAYVSGRIAKLAPDAIRIETPSAILGVRGTTLVVKADDK
jgi:hypothetical protein